MDKQSVVYPYNGMEYCATMQEMSYWYSSNRDASQNYAEKEAR